MPTVKDVASKADVSPGTVSNVLTGKRPVAPTTRERVLRVIEELGYQPNILARSLINRRSETIAVVASGLEYFGPSQAVTGIEREADRNGYSIILELIPWLDGSQAKRALATLIGRQVDGIIWAVPEIGNNRDWVLTQDLGRLPPIVFLSMGLRPGLSILTAGNRLGAHIVTAHLISQGRRQIGRISGPADWWEVRERGLGWADALDEAGLPCDESWGVAGDWYASSGELGLRTLLERHPDIDGVVAGNDQMALGVLRAAHLAGLRVPDDLAVAGFDNIPESAYFWPPLTTVDQHLRDVGSEAVRRLNQLIDARLAGEPAPEPDAATVQPELIVRESSASSLPSAAHQGLGTERR
jgi:LacI family transcriptional regulator